MSGNLQWVRAGSWHTDADGDRARHTEASSDDGLVAVADRREWSVFGPGIAGALLQSGSADDQEGSEAAADACLRSRGAVLVDDPSPVSTQALRGLMETWLLRADNGDGTAAIATDRCAADLLLLIEAAEDDSDDAVLRGDG